MTPGQKKLILVLLVVDATAIGFAIRATLRFFGALA